MNNTITNYVSELYSELGDLVALLRLWPEVE